jgi:hypothetical protein
MMPTNSYDGEDQYELLKSLYGLFCEENSFYNRANAVPRLFTEENVFFLMDKLPHDFRSEFIAFAKEAYVPEGPRLMLGSGIPMPEACLKAVRHWFRTGGPEGWPSPST